MKVCFKCGLEKPMGDFYAHPSMGDGHLGKCKECTKRDVRKHREENDSVREYDRRRYHADPARKARSRAVADKWAKENPHKRKAQGALAYAVRRGRVQRTSCEKCGKTKVQGHHEDYSRPLDVMWLCVRCHHRHHAGYK